MEAPEISVIMPVYNSADTVSRAIESILCQSFSNFEFIIINDFGSIDGTYFIVEKYANNDKRVQLKQIEKRRIGIAQSLNYGISLAKGRYIVRMDADDYSYPQRLEKQWTFMEENPQCIICGSSYRVVSSVGSQNGIIIQDENMIQAELLFRCVLAHPTIIMRRSALEENDWHYDKDYFCEDFELWTRIPYGITNLPDILLDYYDMESNTSSKNKEKVAECSCMIVRKTLRNRLHVEEILYDDAWIWPDLAHLHQIFSFDLAQEGRLLLEIEQQNIERNAYDDTSLAIVLKERWNYYVWEMSFLSGNIKEEIGAVPVSVVSNESFKESLAKSLCVQPGEIIINLQKRMEKLRENYMKRQHIKKCIVFGAGKRSRTFFQENAQYLPFVLFFCDSNPAITNDYILGKEVRLPEKIQSDDEAWIVISSRKNFNEMRGQLIREYRVDSSRIASDGLFNFLFAKGVR